jgi:hypothetical protein
VDSLNLAYSSAEGVLFNKAQSVLIEYPAGKAGPYTIPNRVTSIGGGAFESCTGLTSITIPRASILRATGRGLIGTVVVRSPVRLLSPSSTVLALRTTGVPLSWIGPQRFGCRGPRLAIGRCPQA